MNKDEFLRQLEVLLSGISQEERTEALAFYRSYFEDAGEANEAKILEELESPQKHYQRSGCAARGRVFFRRAGSIGRSRVESGSAERTGGSSNRSRVESGSAGGSAERIEGSTTGSSAECSVFYAGEGWNAGMGDRSSGHHFAGVAGNDSGHTVSIARHCGGAVWNCNSGCGSHGSTVNLRCGALWCRNRKCICRKSCNRNRAYGRRTHRAGDRYSCGGARGLDFRRISAMGIERNLEALQKAI